MRMRLYKALLAGLVLLMVGDFGVRGIAPAVSVRKSSPSASNDFAGPWIGAVLWRHGQNPYDDGLTRAVGRQLVRDNAQPLFLIYPVTTYTLLTPFTFMSWHTANLAWILVGLIGVTTVALVLLGLSQFKSEDIRSWLLVAIVFSLTPLRAGLLVENPAIVSIPLCLYAVYLGSREKDIAAGITLAIATALKPHLGIWILLFYLVRRRWRFSLSCIICGVVITAVAFARLPFSPFRLLTNYTHNLHQILGPAGQDIYSAANHLGLLNLERVLYPLVGRSGSLLACLVFAIGLATWFWAIHRNPSCPETLALGSLLALSFLPIYHRIYNVGILTLILCWALGRAGEPLGGLRRIALILMLLFLIPERAFQSFSDAYLPTVMRSSAWWEMIIQPHAVWILLLLNIVLISALVEWRTETNEAEFRPLLFSEKTGSCA